MSEAAAPARDFRIDQIGFAGELQKRHVDNLKSAVKVRMTGEGLDLVAGDFFEGRLVATETGVVDPAKLLNLWAKDKITRAQLLSALSVRKEPLAEFLSRGEIEAMSTTAAGSPQLRVTRIKGVELKLVDAVKGLGESLPGPD